MKKKSEYIEYEDGTRVLLDENDAPELTEEWFKSSKRFDEMPKEFQDCLKAITRGRPKKATPKQPVKIRLDDDIVTFLRATGKGWQTRLNGFLHTAIEQGKL